MSKYLIKMNGKEYEMEIELMGENEKVAAAPKAVSAAVNAAPAAPKAAPAASAGGAGSVVSPMPGTVLKVNAKEGDAVKSGQSVLILEAMKMENEITAPKDGVIKTLKVTEGQTVANGELLFEVE